jgi:hypothetical protein
LILKSIYLFRSSSAKEKLREESLQYLTKDRILQLIEEGFDTAKAPVNRFISHFLFFLWICFLVGKTLQQTISC